MILKLRGRSFYVSLHRSVGRSVCLWNKCQKSVKNCQKRGFETNNDCTSKYQDYKTILECTIVHTSIKHSLFSWEAAIKEQRISNCICTNTTETPDHTYRELSVATATLVCSKVSKFLNSCPDVF